MPLDVVEVLVVAAVIRNGDQILAAKRLPGGAAGGKWEFPGGKVEQQESPEVALEREIHEELGLDIEVGAFLGEFTSLQGHRLIRLRCYWSKVNQGEPVLHAHSEVRWCGVSELGRLDWADPDIPAVKLIVNELVA